MASLRTVLVPSLNWFRGESAGGFSGPAPGSTSKPSQEAQLPFTAALLLTAAHAASSVPFQGLSDSLCYGFS